jgi:hypothetical protein
LAAAESGGLFDDIRRYLDDSPVWQFGLGCVTGGLAGAAPGGFLAAPIGEATGLAEHYPAAFRAGYGLGEAAWGVAQMIVGGGGEVLGVGLDLTGIGAVLGVPINVAAGVVIVEGAADVGVGAAVFMSAFDDLPEGTHHVTDDPNLDETRSSTHAEALAESLEREGSPRPPNHEPHHVVPANDPRGARATEILEEAGIGVDDAQNGVWLPRTSAGASTPGGIQAEAATSHDSVHTTRYFTELTERLERAREADRVAEEMEFIRLELQLGRFPH